MANTRPTDPFVTTIEAACRKLADRNRPEAAWHYRGQLDRLTGAERQTHLTYQASYDNGFDGVGAQHVETLAAIVAAEIADDDADRIGRGALSAAMAIADADLPEALRHARAVAERAEPEAAEECEAFVAALEIRTEAARLLSLDDAVSDALDAMVASGEVEAITGADGVERYRLRCN